MFKMQFQITNKPVYQPPVPNIRAYTHQNQIQINAPLVISNPVVFGSIFGAMISKGPCQSCG